MQHEHHAANEETGTQSAAQAVRMALRFSRVIWRRKFIVITAGLIGILLGIMYCKSATPIYQANSSLYIQQSSADMNMLKKGLNRNLISTYRELFVGDAVLQGALEKLAGL